MCEPITLIAGALGLAGSMMAMSQPAPPKPPPAETPALAAPLAKDAGATVRLGDSDNNITNNLSNESETKPFVERRVSGTSLGNLGKSGLAL